MAYRLYSNKLQKTDANIALVTAGNADTVVFTRTAFYAATGTDAKVLAYGRSLTLSVDGELVSGNGATISGGAASGIADIRIGAEGSVLSAGGKAFVILGDRLTFYNRGEVSGAAGGLAAEVGLGAVTNSGSIAGRMAVVLTGQGFDIDNSGEIIGQDIGIQLTAEDGEQRITNSGLISAARGTAVNLLSFGPMLVTNTGTISGRTGINLASDYNQAERIIVNSGTISGREVAVYGSAVSDTLQNDGLISGRVNLYFGDDLFDGRSGVSTGPIDGGDGFDILVGSLLTRNRLIGGAGDDELTGGDANDVLTGGAGRDLIDGGAGFDMASYRDSAYGVEVVLGSTDYIFSNSDSDTLVSIEGIEGSRFDDALGGTDSRNRLVGGDGNDLLVGFGGYDVLVGGAGDDRYRVGDEGDSVREDAAGGYDSVETTEVIAILADNVEALYLNRGGTQYGIGNASDNLIVGYGFVNVLSGGEGNDTLIGGSGQDAFVFGTAPAATNADTIRDFEHGIDRLQLGHPILAALAVNGVLPEERFRLGASAGDADDRIIYNPGTGDLFFDPDGKGGAAKILLAHLDFAPTVTAADFTFF